jgi:hypothetical protein
VTEPHDAYADDMVLAEGIARYQPFVTEEVTRVTSSGPGCGPSRRTAASCSGPIRTQPDFVWVAGQGGYGFQTAPAASRLVADLVAGRDPACPPRSSPRCDPTALRTGARRQRHDAGGGPDPRRSAPAALRNRDLIARELVRLAPPRGRALESRRAAASTSSASPPPCPGSPGTPTDPDPGQRASIAAWIAAEGWPKPSRRPARSTCRDRAGRQEEESADLVVVVNLLHLIGGGRRASGPPRDRGRADAGRHRGGLRPVPAGRRDDERGRRRVPCGAAAPRPRNRLQGRHGRRRAAVRAGLSPCGNRADAGEQPASRLRKGVGPGPFGRNPRLRAGRTPEEAANLSPGASAVRARRGCRFSGASDGRGSDRGDDGLVRPPRRAGAGAARNAKR